MKTLISAERSLAHTICRAFDAELDGEDFSTIFSQTISYLTKGITAFKFQAAMKVFCKGTGFSAKDFRLKLHESRYMSLNLKLFMLRLGRYKSINLDIVKELARELEIRVIDAKRMVQVWEQHPGLRKRIKTEARSIPEHRLPLLTIEGINEFFRTVVYKPVLKYIKWEVYKKLTFISRSNNEEYRDFHNDVLAKVVQAFYSMVPIVDKSDAHVINGLKQTVHNHVINIIKSETSQKKGRLIPIGVDSLGRPINMLVVTSQNQMAPVEGQDDSYDEVHGGTGNNLDRFELEFSISEILGKLRERSKKHRFVQILMGHDDPEFTAWLQEKKVAARNEDNVDVQMKMSTEDFNKLLGEFLHVEEHKLAAFISRLRKDLALPENMRQPAKINA